MNLAALKELLVLRVVQDHPAHGYALAEALDQSIGWTLGLTRPTVYSVLQRLEKRGWLGCEKQRDRRYPTRHVYSLTPQGRTGYRELTGRMMDSHEASLQPFAALLIHADELSPDTRRETLMRLRDVRLDLIERLTSFPPHGGTGGIAVSLMLRQLEAEVEAVDALLEKNSGDVEHKESKHGPTEGDT